MKHAFSVWQKTMVYFPRTDDTVFLTETKYQQQKKKKKKEKHFCMKLLKQNKAKT